MDTSHDHNSPRDDHPRGLLPSFRTPEPPPPDPDPGPADLDPEPAPRRLPRVMGLGAPRPSLADSGPGEATPTATSSPGSRPATAPSESEVAALVVGLLAVVTVAAAGVIRWQLRRQLRKPTKTQSRNIAGPVARIMLRRVDMFRLAPDLADMLTAAAATGEYIGDGPLLLPLLATATNLPDDLQETDQ